MAFVEPAERAKTQWVQVKHYIALIRKVKMMLSSASTHVKQVYMSRANDYITCDYLLILEQLEQLPGVEFVMQLYTLVVCHLFYSSYRNCSNHHQIVS